MQTIQKIEEKETFSNSFYEATITLTPESEKDYQKNKKKERKITGQYPWWKWKVKALVT